MIRLAALALVSLAALAACNPYDPELPNHPFLCGGPANDKCPEGFTCNADMVCEKVATGSDVDASTAFQCANDTIEPNDVPNQAYRTPIPMASLSTALASLAICPGDDKDHFHFGVDRVGINMEATVVGMAGRPSLTVNLLNSNGTKIADGAPVSGNPQQVRMEVPNRLAVGDYVVQVLSPDGQQNNYEITIKTCTTPLPCP